MYRSLAILFGLVLSAALALGASERRPMVHSRGASVDCRRSGLHGESCTQNRTTQSSKEAEPGCVGHSPERGGGRFSRHRSNLRPSQRHGHRSEARGARPHPPLRPALVRPGDEAKGLRPTLKPLEAPAYCMG